MTTRQELGALAEQVRDACRSTALSWGIVLDGRLSMSGGISATPRTVFRIASMTKSFTAAAVLARRDAGQLRLDDDAPLLAGVRATTDSPPVTYRHLLSMDAGLAEDDPWADRHLDMTATEIEQLVERGVVFAVPTGTAFEYSNLGYALLGDRSVDTTTLLLEPLGMSRTTWTQPAHDDWARPTDGAPLGHGAFAGMGGLWSCVDDLATWVAWLDDAFPARDDPDDGPLRRASRREMQQVHRTRGAEAGGYGFGLSVISDPHLGTIVSHSGGLPGYGSSMRWLPGRRVGVITLANSTYAPMGALAQQMLGVLDDHGLVPASSVDVPPSLQRAAEGLVDLLGAWDDDLADRLFADNVALDEPYSRRAAAAAELVAAQGPLHLEAVTATTATRGTATVAGTLGTFTIELMLTPLVDGCLERYAIRQ